MRTTLRILSVLFIVIVIFVLVVEMTWDRPLSAPYPDIRASSDSATIARGEYLVYGPAHCAECHFPGDRMDEALAGERMPLSGGLQYEMGPMKLNFPNITPDEETGIGKLSDKEIARTLRYSVGSDGRYILPELMPFTHLSDEDLTAIISFLRSQPPVSNSVEPSSYQFIAKVMIGFGLLPVVNTTGVAPRRVKRDSTAIYGAYLTRSVSNCSGCHTNRDLMTGEAIGPEFAGGMYFEPDQFTEGFSFVSPNLTPDPETGVISDWDLDTFIERFRDGRIYKGSPMYWNSFANMDKHDLTAIYNFLNSLPPVMNRVPETVLAPGEEYKR